jgi:hypothetical protein
LVINSSNSSSENGNTGEETSEDRKEFAPVKTKKDETKLMRLYSVESSIEYGERGPQGNRTRFIPMGDLVYCPSCTRTVKQRVKGQRCIFDNTELVPLVPKKRRKSLKI